MKFKTTFPLIVQITLWLIFLLSIIGILIGIMVLCNVRIANLSYGQAKILLAFCPFTLIFSFLLSTIHYKIDDTHVHLNIAFIDILGNKISIENILNVVIKNNNLYISYIWKGMDPVIAQISISHKKYKNFVDFIMSKNKNIIYCNEDENENTNSQQ